MVVMMMEWKWSSAIGSPSEASRFTPLASGDKDTIIKEV